MEQKDTTYTALSSVFALSQAGGRLDPAQPLLHPLRTLRRPLDTRIHLSGQGSPVTARQDVVEDTQRHTAMGRHRALPRPTLPRPAWFNALVEMDPVKGFLSNGLAPVLGILP